MSQENKAHADQVADVAQQRGSQAGFFSGNAVEGIPAVSITGNAIALRLSSEMAEIKKLFASFSQALEDWK